MIVGIGIDIIEIARVAKAYQRWGQAFLSKIYTETEIAYCLNKHDPAPSLAARFAAKEAAFKALSQAGVEIRSWQDIEVSLDESDRPTISVRGIGGIYLQVSLSHSREHAMSLVLALRD